MAQGEERSRPEPDATVRYLDSSGTLIADNSLLELRASGGNVRVWSVAGSWDSHRNLGLDQLPPDLGHVTDVWVSTRTAERANPWALASSSDGTLWAWGESSMVESVPKLSDDAPPIDVEIVLGYTFLLSPSDVVHRWGHAHDSALSWPSLGAEHIAVTRRRPMVIDPDGELRFVRSENAVLLDPDRLGPLQAADGGRSFCAVLGCDGRAWTADTGSQSAPFPARAEEGSFSDITCTTTKLYLLDLSGELWVRKSPRTELRQIAIDVEWIDSCAGVLHYRTPTTEVFRMESGIEWQVRQSTESTSRFIGARGVLIELLDAVG